MLFLYCKFSETLTFRICLIEHKTIIIIITSAPKSNVVHLICWHWPFIWRWIFSLKNILNLGIFVTQSFLTFWLVDYFFDASLVRNVWKRALFLLSFQDWGQQLHMLLQCWPAACVWFLIEAVSTSAVRLRVLIWPSRNGPLKKVLSGLITDQIKC